MPKRTITPSEQLVVRYLSANLNNPVFVHQIANNTGLTVSEVNTALCEIGQNVLLPDASKIRTGKWKNSKYHLLNKHTKINDFERQLIHETRNFRRDSIKITKLINNGKRHPKYLQATNVIVQCITDINNSVALANVGRLPNETP